MSEWGPSYDAQQEASQETFDPFEAPQPLILDPGSNGPTYDPTTESLPVPTTTEEAVEILRRALGMCIQLMVAESIGISVDDETKRAVKKEAIRTNVHCHRFDPRFGGSDE